MLDNLERIGGVRPAARARAAAGAGTSPIDAAPGWASSTCTRRAACSRAFASAQSPYLADLRRCEILLERFADFARATRRPGRDARAFVRRCRRSRSRPAMSARPWFFASWRRRARTIWLDWRRLAARHGVQIYLQSGGLESIRPARRAGPAAQLRGRRRTGDPRVRTRRLHPNQPRGQSCHGSVGPRPARAAPGRYGIGPILRPGQLHAALGTASRPRRGRRGRRGAGRARRRPMPRATASKMPTSSRKICSNRRTLAHGPEIPTIWCFSIRRVPGRLKSWNVWHSGGRDGSCIFPVIQGVWRAMPGSWCRPKGSG